MNDYERFASKVQFGECWIWKGSLDPSGYGHWYLGRKTLAAHRWAYEQWVGQIPIGMQIDHLCRARACVRPEHLEVVTKRENQRRGIKGVLTTHCPDGHAYDDANTHWYQGHRFCRACNRAAQAKRKAVVIATEATNGTNTPVSSPTDSEKGLGSRK